MTDPLLSRKFLISAGALLLASVFLQVGQITPDQWTELAEWVVTAYAGGNALTHWARRRS